MFVLAVTTLAGTTETGCNGVTLMHRPLMYSIFNGMPKFAKYYRRSIKHILGAKIVLCFRYQF